MSATPVATPEANTEAAEAAVEAIAGAADQDATFSLQLTQDQKDIRDWVHGFAADVMRPAAHEWDEKEQTPWPIIQEAAKIGLYGFEGIWRSSSPTRPVWGCRSSTRSCSGATPASAWRSWAPRSPSPRSSARARASRSASGSRAASARVDDIKVAAFCASEPNAGSDVSNVRTARSSTRRPASGCSTARRRGPRTAGSPTSTS